MAYTNIAYQLLNCTTSDGEDIDIYIKHASDNSMTSLSNLAPNGLRIETGVQSGDLFEPFRETYITLTVVDDSDDTLFADLESAEDMEYLLVINRGGTELARGFLDPAFGGRYQKQNTEVVLKATTGLQFLKTVEYPTVTGRASVVEIVNECLDEIGYSLSLNFDNDVYPTGVTSTWDSLKYTFWDREHFAQRKSDGELAIKSCYDVLESVMIRYTMTLSCYGGAWYIQHWPQYASGNITRFTYAQPLSLNFVNTSEGAATVTPATTYDGATFNMVDDYPFIQRRTPYGTFDLTYEHATDYAYLKNGGFSAETGGWADDWTRNGTYSAKITLETDGIAPETPNETDWNNNSVKIDPYYYATEPGGSPYGNVPYFNQATRYSITAVDDVEWKFKFTARCIPRANNYLRKQGRAFFWRIYNFTASGRKYFWPNVTGTIDGTYGGPDWEVASVDTVNDRVTFSTDTPFNGQTVELMYDQGTTPIGGLTQGNVYELSFTSATVAEFTVGGENLTSAGTGTHRFIIKNGATWTRSVAASYNRVEIRPDETKQFEYVIPRFPSTDKYYIEFYGLTDHIVTADPGTDNWDPDDWSKGSNTTDPMRESPDEGEPPDVVGLLIDGVYLIEPDVQRTDGIRNVLTSTERRREYPAVSVYAGEGPFNYSGAAITLSSTGDWGTSAAENWNGLGLGPYSLDEWWLRVYAKYLGTPRLAKTISFDYVSDRLTPVECLTLESNRYYPAHFYEEPLDGRFGGTFIKIATAANTVTITEFEDVTVYTINGPTGVTGFNSLTEITENIGLATSGEIRLGNGVDLGSGFTGIRIYKDETGVSDVYRVSGWNSDTIQAYLDSDGKFYAGGGAVTLDVNGLDLDVWGGIGVIGDDPSKAITFGGDQYFIYVTDQGISASYLTIWSKDTDGTISIVSGSASGDIALTSTDDIVLTATNVDFGTTKIKDSDGLTGTVGQILSQDAGGIIWKDESSGAFTGLTLAGDAGTPQAIADTNTITIAGGTGIDTSAGATDTVTVNITAGGVDTTQLADNAVTVGKLAHSTANHVVKMDGSGIPTTGTVATANIADDAVTVAKVSPTGGSEGQVIGISSGNPAWVTPASGGFTNLTLAGTSGTPQTILDTNTITIAAGTGLTTTAGATDTVTVAIASLGVDTAQLADNAVTSAKIAHSTANHIMYFNGSGVPTTGFIVNDNITNATIQYGKLSPTGGSEGNVLSISGGNVAWAAPSAGGTMDDWLLYINGSPEGTIADAGVVDFRNNSNITWTWNDTTKALEATVSGLMANFTLAGTSGTPQTISNGNTLTIAAGTGITTTAGATDTVTIANTGIVSLGWGIDGGSPYTVSSGDTIELAQGTGITMTQASGVITVNANGLPTTIDLQTTTSAFDDMEHEGTTDFVGANFSNDSIVMVKGHVMATTQTDDDHAAFKFEAVVEVTSGDVQSIKWERIEKLYDTTAYKLQMKLAINTNDFSVQVANTTTTPGTVTTNWKGQFTAQELANF